MAELDDLYAKASQVMEELARQVHNAVDGELLELHRKAETVDLKIRELEEKANVAEKRRLEAKVDEIRIRRLRRRDHLDKNPGSVVVQDEEDIDVEDDDEDLTPDTGLKAFAELHGLASIVKRKNNEL